MNAHSTPVAGVQPARRTRYATLLCGALALGMAVAAEGVELAIDGAAEKLEHKLDHLFGKLRGKPRAAVVPFTGKANDKLLAEEFDENEQAAINS